MKRISQPEYRIFPLSEQKPIYAVHARAQDGKPPFSNFHMHYEVELGIVVRGRMDFFLERYHHRLAPGDTWLTGIWEPHACRMLEAPYETVVLTVLPHLLLQSDMLRTTHSWLAPFTASARFRLGLLPKSRQLMLAIGRRLAERIERQAADRDVWLRILLIEALATWRESWRAPLQDDPAKTIPYNRLNRAIQSVFASRAQVSPQKAADACGISRGHFDHVFCRAMGISFAQFALRYRLSRVARQLLNTQEPLKTIAAAWGFVDVSHLHRHFLRRYGCTPGAYRARQPGNS